MLATFLGSIVTGKYLARARVAWNGETEKRVTATANLLAQLRAVKAMGLSGSLSANLEQKREVELDASLRERYLLLWVFAFGKVFPRFTVYE